MVCVIKYVKGSEKMLFEKNKSKVFLLYFICYITLFLFISLLSFISVVVMVIFQLFLLLVIFLYSKIFIAEFKETVYFGEENLICKNFVINGGIANAEIPYKKIERIEFKKGYVSVVVSGKKPFGITNTYIDYNVLCETLCEKCKNAEIIR